MTDSAQIDVETVEVVAPNLKRRLSGVTSTIVQLIPLQRAMGVKIASFGPGLPASLPHVRWTALFSFWRRPSSRRFRIWHCRRNIEMLAGIFMRDVLRMKLRLIFTSAAQRHHKAFTRWLIRRMNAVIATSGRSGSYLEVPHDVIMHGIDLTRFHPPRSEEDSFAASGLPGRYAVGCFGRIRPSKGTDLFVDAMIALLPHYPEWTAIITGRATAEYKAFEDGLKKKIEAAGLQDRILIMGELPDVRIWYRRLSLYVAPSRNEGFGLTPLEAMASKTAIVASEAGAYAEMIIDGTGKVVEAGDGAALIQAIEPYLADPAKAQREADNALAHVQAAFPLEKEAAAINQIYERVFAGK